MPDSNITKRALAQAMKELMAAHPFSKISVGDICEACGMNRKSFYYHFRDKQDLVNWIFESEFVETLQVDEDTCGWSLLACMCHYFYGFFTAAPCPSKGKTPSGSISLRPSIPFSRSLPRSCSTNRM